MTENERRLALDELTSSEERVVNLVAGLTPEQWSFRESPDRWSIAENVEHLVVFEGFLMGIIAKMVEADGLAGERPNEVQGVAERDEKERLVLGLSGSRSVPLRSREVVRPSGRWPDTAVMVDELRQARARTVAFAGATNASLRSHFFTHVAFGDLDGYQWLLLIGQHTARHVLQIEQVMADPGFPRSA
ncbi:DinB family protein [Granulicella sibirica]|nr:DinB family protein [Granulicella sibirica]